MISGEYVMTNGTPIDDVFLLMFSIDPNIADLFGILESARCGESKKKGRKIGECVTG